MESELHYDAVSQSSSSPGPSVDYCHLMAELKAQNFDVIKFSSYRTACKLRFIQKRMNFNSVDIWNVIEAFRENNMNSLDSKIEMTGAHLNSLLMSIFFQLNKRLPSMQQIDLEQCSSLLQNWLMCSYDTEKNGKFKVFSVKIALSTLSSGKLMDKLRYMFSLICDANGHLVHSKFAEFLRDCLEVPCSVHESPTFGYKDVLPSTMFDGQSVVTVNDFLDGVLGNNRPSCLVWLPLIHRLAGAENVLHPVQCDGCNREAFLGFRYKCQRCYNYQLCQDCFWRGRTSGRHTNDHEMKEYTYYKSPSKQLGHSLKKSFRCVPESPISYIPRFPDEPEKTLNLQHIIPPSPIPMHNGFPENGPLAFDVSSLDSKSTNRSYDLTRGDEEHRLIAHYAARLADVKNAMRSPSDLSLNTDTSRQRELISQLESKNREIMREIMQLRNQEHQEGAALQMGDNNPNLLVELSALRQKKEELETHLSTLQESRKELMLQLESLMKMLKNHQISPKSTPNSSPRSGTKSPPMSTVYPLSSSRSAPTTPGSNPPLSDIMNHIGESDKKLASDDLYTVQNLRNDLLVTADSVTNAMSSLVRDLNSGSDDDEAGVTNKPLNINKSFEGEEGERDCFEGGTLWREERQRVQESEFLAEIQARNLSGAISNMNGGKNNRVEEKREFYEQDLRDLSFFQHSSLTTDDESYVRTDDDEDCCNTEWEETVKRWVNR